MRETVQLLNGKIEQLQGEIAELKKNSRFSSQPPSSDAVKPKKPKTCRSEKVVIAPFPVEIQAAGLVGPGLLALAA